MPEGLKVNIQNRNGDPNHYIVPLLVDPWIRFNPGWVDRYIESYSDSLYTWGIKDKFLMHIESTGKLSAHPFIASRQFLSTTEDPNQDYPESHFFPFPLSVIEITSIDDLSLVLTGK